MEMQEKINNVTEGEVTEKKQIKIGLKGLTNFASVIVSFLGIALAITLIANIYVRMQ